MKDGYTPRRAAAVVSCFLCLVALFLLVSQNASSSPSSSTDLLRAGYVVHTASLKGASPAGALHRGGRPPRTSNYYVLDNTTTSTLIDSSSSGLSVKSIFSSLSSYGPQRRQNGRCVFDRSQADDAPKKVFTANVTRFRIKGTECLQMSRPYAETTIFDKEARRAIKPEALRSVFRFVQSIMAKSEGRNANASRRLPFFPYYHWFRRMEKAVRNEIKSQSDASPLSESSNDTSTTSSDELRSTLVGRYDTILEYLQFEKTYNSAATRTKLPSEEQGMRQTRNFDRSAPQNAAEQLRQLSRVHDNFDFSAYGLKFPFWPSARVTSDTFGVRSRAKAAPVLRDDVIDGSREDVLWRKETVVEEYRSPASRMGVDHLRTPPADAFSLPARKRPKMNQPAAGTTDDVLEDVSRWSATSEVDASYRRRVYSWGEASINGAASSSRLFSALRQPNAGAFNRQQTSLTANTSINGDGESGKQQQKTGINDEEEEDEVIAFSRYAQWTIARSQSLPLNETCATVRVLSEGTHSYGLGADVMMMAQGLAHAMIMNRLLVPSYHWKWTDFDDEGTKFCTVRGFECVFLPPSACSRHEMAAYGKHAKVDSHVLKAPLKNHRILHRMAAFYHADVKWGDVPDLHPPHLTRKEVEDGVGMKYEDWASMQIFRYLMRGFQPWAEVMFLHMMRVHGDGYPWPQDETVVAVHVRNGEEAKNLEIEHRVKCRRLDHSMQLFAAECLARSWTQDMVELPMMQVMTSPGADDNTSSAPIEAMPSVTPINHNLLRQTLIQGAIQKAKVLLTFDDASILDEATEFFRGGAERREESPASSSSLVSSSAACIRTPLFSQVVQASGGSAVSDSRDVVRKRFGKAFLFRMSITNMLLSSSADAWVNNDASHWCKVMHFFARSAGSRRHRFPYVNIEALSGQFLKSNERDQFCRTHFCSRSKELPIVQHILSSTANAWWQRTEGAKLGIWPFPTAEPPDRPSMKHFVSSESTNNGPRSKPLEGTKKKKSAPLFGERNRSIVTVALSGTTRDLHATNSALVDPPRALVPSDWPSSSPSLPVGTRGIWQPRTFPDRPYLDPRTKICKAILNEEFDLLGTGLRFRYTRAEKYYAKCERWIEGLDPTLAFRHRPCIENRPRWSFFKHIKQFDTREMSRRTENVTVFLANACPEAVANRRWVFLDLGARDFESSTGWFRSRYPRGEEKLQTMHAFEVDRRFAQGYSSKSFVTFHRAAIWDRDGYVTFLKRRSVAIDMVGAEVLFHTTPDKPPFDRKLLEPLMTVDAIGLSGFLYNNTREEDFVIIKMDVEGAEWALLESLAKSGALNRVDELFIECHSKEWNPAWPHDRTPADCHRLFNTLRNVGIFAHEWI